MPTILATLVLALNTPAPFARAEVRAPLVDARAAVIDAKDRAERSPIDWLRRIIRRQAAWAAADVRLTEARRGVDARSAASMGIVVEALPLPMLFERTVRDRLGYENFAPPCIGVNISGDFGPGPDDECARSQVAVARAQMIGVSFRLDLDRWFDELEPFAPVSMRNGWSTVHIACAEALRDDPYRASSMIERRWSRAGARERLMLLAGVACVALPPGPTMDHVESLLEHEDVEWRAAACAILARQPNYLATAHFDQLRALCGDQSVETRVAARAILVRALDESVARETVSTMISSTREPNGREASAAFSTAFETANGRSSIDIPRSWIRGMVAILADRSRTTPEGRDVIRHTLIGASFLRREVHDEVQSLSLGDDEVARAARGLVPYLALMTESPVR